MNKKDGIGLVMTRFTNLSRYKSLTSDAVSCVQLATERMDYPTVNPLHQQRS